jgi:hypothetical protein
VDQSQELFRLIGNGLLVCAALVCTASVVMHARVPWWRSEMGRHLMAYMGVMAATLDLGVIKVVFGDTWWFSLLRLLVFCGVPIVMAQRLWLQVKAQRAARDERDLDATNP